MTAFGFHPDITARLRAAGCVFAEDEAQVLLQAASTPSDLAAMVDRRVAGAPLEYVVGWALFCGVRIVVDAGVFIPRRRTELLVREAAAVTRKGSVVVDLCCGSGAVAVALARSSDRLEVHAVDVDAAAVQCARRNVEPVGGRVYLGDLYEPLPGDVRGRVDLVVANAPYVPTSELGLMPAEARLHEPRVALHGGPRGLDVLERVITRAPEWLATGGHVLVESSERQAPQVVEFCMSSGMDASVRRCPDTDATVVLAGAPA